MKKVLLIANFMDIDENTNNRFNYLAEILKNKCKLQVITSTFSHRDKIQRTNTSNKNIQMIYEPGYKKNTSIKRLYSHYILSKNLKEYLKSLKEKVDVIYCAIPSLSFAKVAAKYAKKNNIQFIIDIQDLWPEAFEMVFKIPILSKLIFWPLKMQADYIYKRADDIIAVSGTYLNRATQVNKKCKRKLCVFLGTELSYFDKCKEENNIQKNSDELKIAYIGTLGHSYDIKVVIDAIKKLSNKYKNLKFIVMGDGPLKESFEEYAKNAKINCDFTGRLEYPKMIGQLCSCQIAVNPISKGAAQSIINKVGDYAAAGLPVINTQENQEYRDIVNDYKIGFNCKNNDASDVAEKLEILINDKKLRIKMGQNNRKLAEKKFDRKKTYEDIIKLIIK